MRGAGVEDGGLTPERLTALLAATLPEERLTAEELRATMFDDPEAEVLAVDDGAGIVAIARRGTTGFVTAVVVDPALQRRGVGRRLLALAHDRLRDLGADAVRTGAAAPRYLWPGVDVEAHAAAVGLFRSAGYEVLSEEHNHRCAVTFRAPEADGVAVRRVQAASNDAEAVVAFASSAYPDWVDEVERGVVVGCCHGAFDAGTSARPAVGFACHSVNRAGWIGPMATDRAWQGRGIGSALLGAVCHDLDLAGFEHAEIAWVGPDRFYEKAAGATVSRRFVILGRAL